MVNNTYSVTWIPYIKFRLKWLINKILVAKMTSYGWSHDKTTPIATPTVPPNKFRLPGSLAYAKIQPGRFFDQLLIAKQPHVIVAMAKPHPMWLIMLTEKLGDHSPNLSLIGLLISFWKPKQYPDCAAIQEEHKFAHLHAVNKFFLVTWRLHSKFGPF